MNTEDAEKIKLLDQAFKSLTLDDVKSVLSADLLVGKLKAQDNSPGPLIGALQELSILQVEIVMLRNELNSQKADFVTALKVLTTLSNPPAPYYSSDLQNLKSKHGIY